MDELIEISSSGNFSLEIQSGAFRFYPRDDKAKQGIWKLRTRWGIPTKCTRWEEVWSLYFFPLRGDVFEVSIQS